MENHTVRSSTVPMNAKDSSECYAERVKMFIMFANAEEMAKASVQRHLEKLTLVGNLFGQIRAIRAIKK